MTNLIRIDGEGEEPLAQALNNGVGLVLREDLTEQEWIEVGSRLGRGAQGIQWFIGDWLNYGVKYGYVQQDKYDLAVDLTGMTKDWLYVCAWVARSIAPEDRNPNLTFTHHKQVASLKPSIERAALLQVAAETKMSARDLYSMSNQFAGPSEGGNLREETPDAVVRETMREDDSVSVIEQAPVQLGKAPRPPVQAGEVIELGAHRLIIGDSTDPAIWFKLFDGQEPASVMWTDPPYGVEYVGKTEEAMTIDADTVEDLPRLLALVFSHADRYLLDGSACYICTGFSNHDISLQVIRALGWRFSVELVWVKNHFAMGRGDYHPMHESQLYAFKGDGRRWYGPQNRTTIFGLGPTSDGTFGYTIPRPSAALRHPTMKPPKLIFEQVRNSALNGEIVVDPFAGSGSTMVAAEQLGLRAFMIELNPAYGAEIVDRWKEMQGNA